VQEGEALDLTGSNTHALSRSGAWSESDLAADGRRSIIGRPRTPAQDGGRPAV